METIKDFIYLRSNIINESSNTISDSDNDIKKENKARKFILGWILDKVTSKYIHIFGSCTRYMISNDSFDMIKECASGIKKRDIDIVCYKNYHQRVLNALTQIGEITNLVTHNSHYTSLNKRNIYSIHKVTILVGGSDGTIFSRYMNMLGYDEFSMDIDIVELCNNRIDEINLVAQEYRDEQKKF